MRASERLYAVLNAAVRGKAAAEHRLAEVCAQRDAALSALKCFMTRMDSHGLWDDGCFYYSGRCASELQDAIELGRAAIKKASGERPREADAQPNDRVAKASEGEE